MVTRKKAKPQDTWRAETYSDYSEDASEQQKYRRMSTSKSTRKSQLIQQRRAALIVKIDEELGQPTPQIIKDMAKRKTA